MQSPVQQRLSFWELGLQSIKSLEIESGIMASARDEAYGCVFGRDSLITALLLLSLARKSGLREHVPLVRKILANLAHLQGRETNIESGEEPGKCIHEFRIDRYDHLLESSEPWYVYSDNTLRNYDTVDATPLFLLAMYDFYTLTGDFLFMERHVEKIRAALDWIFLYADKNDDGLLDYSFHPKRKSGGLKTQSWMDSTESVFFEDSDERPGYPIAPVEVQAYAYAALRNFADYFSAREPAYATQLSRRAVELKADFNKKFVHPRGRSLAIAYALDGVGTPLLSQRSSMGHVLWASYRGNGEPQSIIDREHIPALVRRLMQRDLHVEGAGIRTLSSGSKKFDPVSYHNGSIWPHDSALIAEGLESFGYVTESHAIRRGIMRAYEHFETPIELFCYARGFKEYRELSGKGACRVQAWSAASLLHTVHALGF